jgi:hypothetical protein
LYYCARDYALVIDEAIGSEKLAALSLAEIDEKEIVNGLDEILIALFQLEIDKNVSGDQQSPKNKTLYYDRWVG